MSVNKERVKTDKIEKKPVKEGSSSKKHKREESKDRKPVITQEKQPKIRTTLKEKTKVVAASKASSVESLHSRKVGSDEKKRLEKDRKPIKTRREAKTDTISIKDVLEKKIMKKDEDKRLKRKAEENKRQEKIEMKMEVAKSRRDRTRTRTLSPTEIKQLIQLKVGHEVGSGDQKYEIKKEEGKEKEDEREDEVEESGEAMEEIEDAEENYEDDFEDYESDFEQDDSDSIENESNKPFDNNEIVDKPDVPSFRIQSPMSTTPIEPWKLNIRQRELEEIKRSIEKENIEVVERRKSLSKSAENSITEPETESWGKNNDGNILDFSSAFLRQKKKKEAEVARKRGEELLSMISLDAITYHIFELPPISYEEYIQIFGRANTKQVCLQTNEDNLDEEVQTEEILSHNKWTQNPPEYFGSKRTENEVKYILTKEERLGVGGDETQETKEEDFTLLQSKTKGLLSFLSWASQLVLAVLEGKNGNFLSMDNMPNHSKAMAFGDGFVSLNVGGIHFLKGRSIGCLSKNNEKLLSVHVQKDKCFQRCMICVWNFRELSKPLKVLVCSNRVTCCCFGPNPGYLVFAGLIDGSICLWDLREPNTYHNRSASAPEWALQSPTYTTAAYLKENDHSSSITAVRVLSQTEKYTGFGDFAPLQICSIDRNGTLVIWSVIQTEKAQRQAPSEDLGLAHWGRVKLVKSSSFCVFENLRDELSGLYVTCNDILVKEVENDGFYIANSLGSVCHCSRFGSLMKPKFFVPEKQDVVVDTTCLELCPFNSNYFLVGCGNGSIRLHSKLMAKPLIILNPSLEDNDKEGGIVSITWMEMRPCVFFALDSQSRIHIWDLGISDMYPEMSLILTDKKITCMKLLPISDPKQIPFIVIGTENGSLEVHRLKKEYGCRSAADVKNEMKLFLKYVSIL